jgi:lambda family phage portal protein
MPKPKKRSILSTILSPVATMLGLSTAGGYNVTDPRRKILDRTQLWHGRTTANQLLNGSLAALRAYCRNLERNNPTARAGIEALKGLVVGSGIALEPQTGDDKANDLLRESFNDWLESCGVNGESIWQLQQLAMGEIVTAGEALWRLVPDTSHPVIPWKILPLDAEWLRDDAGGSSKLTTVAGVNIDRLGRPVSYFIRNPETDGDAEEVPASQIIHIFERRRPVQHRGEPWFAPLVETLIQERDLVDAELKAAVNTASLGISIESENHGEPDTTEYGTDEDPVSSLGLGSVVRLFPGEKVNAFSHTRPSQQIAPFRQMLRGDIAAALRIPQRFLDRDISRANYSSQRGDMLDTERLLGPVREWVGKQSVGRLYEMALPALAAYNGIAVPKKSYRLLPDGQPYIDPGKDAAAIDAMIAGNQSTLEAEVAKRGGDYRQVLKQRSIEQKQIALDAIAQIQEIQKACDASGVPGLTWAHISTLGGAVSAPGAYLGAAMTPAPVDQVAEGIAAPEPKQPAMPQEEDEETEDEEDDQEELEEKRHARRMELARASAMSVILPSHPITIRNEVPSSPAPVVNVAPSAAVVHVDAPSVTVESARAEPAQITVNVPQQAAPVVNVSAPQVTVENTVEVPQRTIIATPNRDGSVTMKPVE